jgi:adenylate cyclase
MISQEIERKFLVQGDFKALAINRIHITQGYLSTHPERSVRIRITDEKSYLTIKGLTNKVGTTRLEWEKEIDTSEAKALLDLCEPYLIEKIRYVIPTEEGFYYEVDEFQGVNAGLIVAEIELPDENTTFKKPFWLGKEVTGMTKYYNVSLIKHPYQSWK